MKRLLLVDEYQDEGYVPRCTVPEADTTDWKNYLEKEPTESHYHVLSITSSDSRVIIRKQISSQKTGYNFMNSEHVNQTVAIHTGSECAAESLIESIANARPKGTFRQAQSPQSQAAQAGR